MSIRHTEFTLQSRDGTVLYAQSWEPAGTARAHLGIVHGLGEHSGRYAAIVPSILQADIRVTAYDQRGHGRTGGRLPSFATLLNDLDLLIEDMRRRGDMPRFLFGQSLGGTLVLNHALFHRSPLQGVIASSPLLTPAVAPPMWKLALARLLRLACPSVTLATGACPDDLSHDADVVRQYIQDPLVHNRISAILGLSMLQAGRRALQHAEELNMPLLLMHGTGDRLTSVESSREFASRAGGLCTLRIWEGLSHELHFETQRDQVLQYLCDWLRGVSQSP